MTQEITPTLFDLRSLQRALLISIYKSGSEKNLCEDHLAELERLCESYGLSVAAKVPCSLKKYDAATYLGEGKLEELQEMVANLQAQVVIFDDEISPHQQRNLEKIFKCPVLDRTELIIEVFAQRAQTKEAQLQIELAKVKYQFPRLKRMWTHLSRQSGTSGGSGAGGGAYLKGEGEKQIEIDRRLLRRRIDRLQEDLEHVVEHRHTQRGLRVKTGIPTFAIVGYTNVGKSTLLKRLTQADVLIEDRLFATLDTTTRKFALPNKQEILLIDTVGFIRKIPHALVAAFKSTLEEAIHTDILLHLIDVSHPSAQEQAEETMRVLKELGADKQPIITVLNKVDLCTDASIVSKFRVKYPQVVAVSATTGSGLDDLMQAMMEQISALRKIVNCRIPQEQYGLIAELMKEGRVLSLDYEENDILVKLEIPQKLEHKVKSFLYSV